MDFFEKTSFAKDPFFQTRFFSPERNILEIRGKFREESSRNSSGASRPGCLDGAASLKVDKIILVLYRKVLENPKFQGRKKNNKHKQLLGIVPEMGGGGGQICLCVAFFLGKKGNT